MMYQGFEFTRMINGEPKREMVIIFCPDKTNLERALHKLGLEWCLKNQKDGKLYGDLFFPELMEQVTPEMLAPYGISVLWPNRTLISMDNMPPIISRYELETYQEASNSGYSQAKKICKAAEQLARRLESKRTHGHPAISTWAPDIISTKAVTWADQFVHGGETDLLKFFEKKLQEAKPYSGNKNQVATDAVSGEAKGQCTEQIPQ